MPRRRAPDDVKQFKRLHSELMEAAKRLDTGLVMIAGHMDASRTKRERMMLEALRAEVETLRRRTLDALMLLYLEGERRPKQRK
jgi:phosphatidylserine/phosphatidylglycerophosphate/cardiolipin synthase-like enzyme